MKPINSVSVVGYGAAGSALVDFFKDYNSSLVSVWDRNIDDCRFYINQTPQPADKTFPGSLSEIGKTIFICTPDDEIESVAEKFISISDNWTGYNFVHLSGSLSAFVLSNLQNAGASVASMHPLQTFTGHNNAERLQNIWFSLQGDPGLVEKLEVLVADFGSESFRLDESQKKAMHIAAVFASNYMVSLLDVVTEISEENRIDNSLKILEPILKQTLQNVLVSGTSASLSGPVARGDLDTVKSHLDLLKDNDAVTGLYKKLGLRAVTIAVANGSLDPGKADQLRKLFS